MKPAVFFQIFRDLPRGLLVGFAAALLLLIGLGAFSYYNIQRQAAAAQLVAHTYEVAGTLKEIFSSVQDAESAQRAYFLSGIDTYLEPYNESIKNLPGQIAHLRELVGDNPDQQRRVQKLSNDIDKLLELINRLIDQRRTKGEAVLSEHLMTGTGIQLMVAVRADVSLMISEEERQLSRRLNALTRARTISEVAQTIGGIVTLALLLGVFISLVMQMQRASRAEQEAERSNSQLKDANNELRAFSYSVAHDLRSPLRAINGFAQVVVEDYSDKLDEEGKRALDRITVNAKMMADLIDDLLSLSRISFQQLRTDKVDMNELVRGAYQELMEGQNERVVECDIGSLPPASGDPHLLRQVWVNLISNALKFTRQRSRARIEIGGNVAGPEFATYFIRDNGAGFDMQYASKLFGAFQRLHRTTEFEGTGIGLALVQRIIQRHGGTIWAEGKEDEGARFAFTLPEWNGQAGS